MKKIISYSLWGTNEYYTLGAIENILDAKKYFPDFTCRFYVDPQIPYNIKKYIKENAEYIEIDEKIRHLGKNCLRFLPFFDRDVDIFLSRDTDSRLTEREAKIIDKWINEDQTGFLSLYEAGGRGDGCLIDAGMFACNNAFFRTELLSTFKVSMGFFKRASGRQSDREYLNTIIFPIVKYSFTGYANFKIYSGYHQKETYNRLLDEDVELEDMPYHIELDEDFLPVNKSEAIGETVGSVIRACQLFNVKNRNIIKKKRHNQVILLVDSVSNEVNDRFINIYWSRLIEKINDNKNLSSKIIIYFVYGNSYHNNINLPSNKVLKFDHDDSKKSSSTNKLVDALNYLHRPYIVNNIFKLELSSLIRVEELLTFLDNMDRNQQYIMYGDIKKYSLFNYVSKEGYLFNKDTYDLIIRLNSRFNYNIPDDINLGFLLRTYEKNQLKNYKITNISDNTYDHFREIRDNEHFFITFNRSILKMENMSKIEELVDNLLFGSYSECYL